MNKENTNKDTNEIITAIDTGKTQNIVNPDIKALDIKISEIKNQMDEINKKTSEMTTQLLTVLGIFASMLSFFIIEFQLLKSLTGPLQISGFSCILFSLLLGFNLSVNSLAKETFNKTFICWICAVIIIFFIGITILAGC